MMSRKITNETAPARRAANFVVLSLLLVLATAPPAAGQESPQSYLRRQPGEIEREDPRVTKIIEDAEKHFRLGELNLRDKNSQAAREEFDKAVDTVLESGMDVRSNARLNRYYLDLIERVNRFETAQSVPAARAGDTHQPAPPAGGQSEDYVSAVINHAEAQFELGRVYLKNDKPEAAREAFSKAVEIVDASGASAKGDARLKAYRLSLAERIRMLGAGEEPPAGAGFVEQKFEPSPLDELREMVLTVDEQTRPSNEPCGPDGTSHVELRGFRLGLAAEAVRARVPGLAVPAPDRYGQAYAPMNLDPRKVTDPQLRDVRRLAFSFLDGRVTSVTLVYAASADWESAAQFARQVALSMGLTARWGRPEEVAASGEDVRQLKCEGKSVIAGLMYVGRQRYPFVTARDDEAPVRVRARMLAEAERKAKAALAEAERRAREAEERRRAFKP